MVRTNKLRVLGEVNIGDYLKLGHCIMQFKEFDWLSGHGIF